MSSIQDWSKTAADNDDSDSAVNWTEGQNAKTVNNSGRAMMGRVAEYRDDQGGLVTVDGTANAITATLNSAFTTLADGRHFTLQPASDNTDATTLNVNGIGAKAIRKFDSTGEVALASGDLQAGAFYKLIYDSAADSASGAWILLNPTAQPQNSKLTAIAGLAVTDGNIIVGDGTTWVAESGATARTSLGLGSAVIGPASATDSNFAAFDSTTGKLIKDSAKSSSSFATAAQGTKADSALQPVSSTTDNAIARFNGTAGALQNSTATISDAGALSVAGTITASGDITYSSDIALKENIVPIEGALDRVRKLGGYLYDRIDSGAHSAGLIAQEVERVLPEAVHTDEEGMKAVAAGPLIGLLVQAIKELASR